MAKPKYSPETKLAVVNHYLSGKDGEQSTADLFGIERTSVRRWVRAWQFHGAEGLTAKNNHYSDEFKLVVVRAVISDRLTMREANTLCGTFCGRPVCPVARGITI